MKKVSIITEALNNAKTKLNNLKAALSKATETAKADNSRANRKALRMAHNAVVRCQKQVEHLSGELAAAEFDSENKTFVYPKKAATVNAPEKKERKHKERRTNMNTPKTVVKSDKKNEAWEADKAARKAAKKAAPVFVKRVTPNKGMADATTEYLLEVLWEEYLNGNENAIVSIKELSKSGVDPEKASKDMLSTEWKRINKAKKALDDLQYRWTRVNARVKFCETRLAEANKMVAIAKGMVTKAKKAYAESDDEHKLERYDRMMERVRHMNACLRIQAARQQEMTRTLDRMNEFADHWDAEEEYLKESVHRAYNKLDEVVIALRHRRTQERLEDVFQQRYERGDRVISKEEQRKESFRYKMLSVKATTLFNWVVPMLEQLQRLADEKPAGWLLHGRALYRKIADMILAINGPMTVDVKDCQVNNVAASQMSDIMGVDYGANGPCKEMISVNYDITGIFQIYWKFIDEDYEAADRKLRRLREFIMEHLIKDGIDMIDSEPDENLRLFDELLFFLMASNNSQQKKGQATMGEQSVMEATEKFREFGTPLNDALEHRTDNAAEWLKRNATMTTPSKVLKTADGRAIPMSRILMVDDVEIERMFDNVTTIDGKSDKTPKAKKLKLTMFDGQAVWLIDDMPSTQGRGAAMKFFVVAKPDYKLPEYATDIMGNRVRVADYDILMTKSCWKAAKMGMNWYEFRDMCAELAKECPGYDLLRAVRYSDREIGDEENPRNMSRQATQQLIKINDSEVDGLTRRTRRWLKNQKKYANIVAELGEWYLPAGERSAFANLINRHPQIIMHPAIQQFLANAWYAKRNRACSGKLRVDGIYPYICQDPIAMIQICLEGRDPNAEDLGVIPAGKVNLPKVKDGREVYCVRYPANYIVGMVVTQLNRPEFANLGNVAVLSYYGDTITRADGDFDGDEMMFCFDKLIIELMKRVIENFKPTLIDFPHGKVDCSKPFGTKERFCEEIAAALVRAQEFNLVGRYSNLAVICLQQASIATDAKTCGQWLTAAKVAHVGAIVCLDLVKGAEVPEELLALLKKMNTKIRDEHKMPWNQQFSHPELTDADLDPRSRSTQDKIAGAIFDDVGNFEMDFDGEEPIVWLDSYVNELLPTCETRSNKSAPFNPAMKSFAIDPEDARMLRGFKWEDEFDKATWWKIDNGESVGLKEFLMLVWHNASRIMWRMPGVDGAEKRSELDTVVRNIVMKHVLNDAWEDENRSWTLVERYATTVKSIVCYMFGVGFDKEDGHMISNTHKIDTDKMGSWTMFLGRVFGNDIVLASSDALTEEAVKDACTPKAIQNDEMGQFLATLQDEGIDADELRCIMNDGCTSFSASDFDDEEYYPEINVA